MFHGKMGVQLKQMNRAFETGLKKVDHFVARAPKNYFVARAPKKKKEERKSVHI